MVKANIMPIFIGDMTILLKLSHFFVLCFLTKIFVQSKKKTKKHALMIF